MWYSSAAQIFADSKFLREEALLDLVRAVIWAAGGFQRVTASSDETDTEQVRRLAGPCALRSFLAWGRR